MIVTWNSDLKVPELRIAHALGFGPVGAVYGFNRAARLLHHIMANLGDAVSANFFDDFPLVSCAGFADESLETGLQLLSLLGFEVKEVAELERNMQEEFLALGVEFDFKRLAHGEGGGF